MDSQSSVRNEGEHNEVFAINIGLKQRDYPYLRFNIVLEKAVRAVHTDIKMFEPHGSNLLLAYTDDIDVIRIT